MAARNCCHCACPSAPHQGMSMLTLKKGGVREGLEKHVRGIHSQLQSSGGASS